MILLFLLVFMFEANALTPRIEISEPSSASGVFFLNEEGTLICRVHDRQGNTVYWFLQSKNETSSKEISRGLGVSNPAEYSMNKVSGRSKSWRLTIKKVKPSDEGRWSCRLYLSTHGFIEATVEMMVYQRPVIDTKSSTPAVTLNEGEPGRLRCVAFGVPPPVVIWSRIGGEAFSGGGITRIGSEVQFESVSHVDRGIYQCVVRSQAGQTSRQIHVSVTFAPVLTVGKRSYEQGVGYDREISCFIEANPPIKRDHVSWIRNGKPIEANEKYILTYLEGALNKVTWKLYIRDLSSDDFGDYTCLVLNLFEGATGSKQVTTTLKEASHYVPDSQQVISASRKHQATSLVILAVLLLPLKYLVFY